jgi:hypothetical protein
MFSSFILSATCGAIACGKLCATFNRFVLVQAPLALRNFRCHRFGALCHNKANNYAPVGAGRGWRRACF